MGAVSIDLNKNERKLESLFPMNTKRGIQTFLENYSLLQGLIYSSADYDALIMLIDFNRALDESYLSAKEIYALREVFIKDKKRVDVAKELGVTKQTVQSWLSRSTQKLANYYTEIEGELYV
ncbi:hypothetical protein [Jeotgalibacillus marinus]|uniref:RNA polymerase sigma-70 region 4 domain-containing protein n=1 Tax=Jeotgalibacillus marinus TaxID=86667 RepID=A0ABV3Q4V6_9BACL